MGQRKNPPIYRGLLANATDKDSFDQPILANLHYERSNHRVGDRNFLDVLVALPFSPGEYCAELAILATIFTGARGLPLWLKNVPVFNAIHCFWLAAAGSRNYRMNHDFLLPGPLP